MIKPISCSGKTYSAQLDNFIPNGRQSFINYACFCQTIWEWNTDHWIAKAIFVITRSNFSLINENLEVVNCIISWSIVKLVSAYPSQLVGYIHPFRVQTNPNPSGKVRVQTPTFLTTMSAVDRLEDQRSSDSTIDSRAFRDLRVGEVYRVEFTNGNWLWS